MRTPGQYQNQRAKNKTAPGEEEIIGPYKDDLEFLNKLSSQKIAKLQSAFKNKGRGNVRSTKIQAW